MYGLQTQGRCLAGATALDAEFKRVSGGGASPLWGSAARPLSLEGAQQVFANATTSADFLRRGQAAEHCRALALLRHLAAHPPP